MTEPILNLRLTVSASDLASVIEEFVNFNMPVGWESKNKKAYMWMMKIAGEPFGEVDWRVADVVVCAMGLPHVLANGRVEVIEGEPIERPRQRVTRDGYLPAEPFQVWMKQHKENFPTQTAMYNALDIPYVSAKNYMKATTKFIPTHIIMVALSRAGLALTELYPKGEHGYRDFQVG